MNYFLLILLILITPFFCFAADDFTSLADYGNLSKEVSSAKDLDGYLNLIFKIMIASATLLAVIMIIVGGLQYMTADSIGGKGSGKQKITSAIGGLILALSSYLILYTINPNLLKIDFTLKMVGKENGGLFDYTKILSFPAGEIPGYVTNSPAVQNGTPPDPKPGALAQGSETVLRNTKYYISNEDDFSGSKNGYFILEDGTKIPANSTFVNRAEIEGTAKLSNGTVLNYSSGKRSDGTYRWKESEYEYGIGAYSNPLTPYRSVAVDPNVIPLGSKLFIRETAGMKIPEEYGGGTHDGVWYAHDGGSAIKGDRVDLFVGREKYSNTTGLGHLQGLNTVILERP